MKPEEQRIAIAEACGWTDVRRENVHDFGGLRGNKPNDVRMIVPSFCRSLDAMHEAEKVLPDRQLYRHFLYLVALEDPLNTANEPAFTTATQRAEAFLRTLNLWKDEN